MLPIKKIDKIRHLYFDVGMKVIDIWRKTNISTTTIYKYLKMEDFSPQPVKPRTRKPSIADKYEKDVRAWLLEDKSRHHKQRHTAMRIYERLGEIYSDFDVSYPIISKLYNRVRSEVYYTRKEYAPLNHLPGEAQVDMGECIFYEKGLKVAGYYLVVSFPYSNAGFCQLYKGKNSECFIQGMKNIFAYIGGVPHEITFDNDGALVSIKDERTPKRCEHDLFLRFKNHYDFRCDYCNSHSPNHKGHVESKVKYLRKRLLVPVPEFDDLDVYNRELLERCTELLHKKHYRAKETIFDLFSADKKAMLSLPTTDFEVATIKKRKVNEEGKISINKGFNYCIHPKFARKYVQIKYTYNKVYAYDQNLNLIVEYERMYGDPKQTATEWGIWLPIISRRANSLFHSSLTNLFSSELKDYLLSGLSKLRREFLSAMAQIITSSDLDTAIAIAEIAAEKHLLSADDLMKVLEEKS